MPKLTVKQVQAKKKPGMYGDGGGLYLRVGPTGAKSWIVRTRIEGAFTKSGLPLRWEGGLGSIDHVPLSKAREKALTVCKLAREGKDPRTEREKKHMSFEEAARAVHANLLPTWRNRKHAETWLATIENYAVPDFGSRPIETVGTADVLRVLTPIWTDKNETAKRLKQRLSTIFDWAKGAGHYPHENPVNGIKKALPTVKRRPKHLAAMPWQELPHFMADLSERSGVSARTLEFLILTAARSGEGRGARWREIEANAWTIPADRMKRGISHRVPLSDEALRVLEQMRGHDADLVFPSAQRGDRGIAKVQSVMVFKSLLKRMGCEGFTVHGFRSTFRDWCSESARVEREIAEAALSHAVGNEVERAYARSDLFERRQALMSAWGQFATGKAGEVVQMVRA